MLSPELSRQALRQLFRQRRVVDLALLFKTLRTESAMSVFRRLSGLGYLTSYSHARRYYTLDHIPDFDGDGLWQYQGVFFSKHGTLKDTVAHMVEVADAGRTHRELRARLRVHVHNTLLDLVKSKRTGRELLDGLFLYVSAGQERAAAQVAQRRQRPAAVAQTVVLSGQSLEIAVLLEVIHGARLIPDPAQIVERLAGKAVQVAREQVEAIFHKHGLKNSQALAHGPRGAENVRAPTSGRAPQGDGGHGRCTSGRQRAPTGMFHVCWSRARADDIPAQRCDP